MSTDDDHIRHLDHPEGPRAAQLILALMACRYTEPGCCAAQETINYALDRVIDTIPRDCRYCLRELLCDLAWTAAEWAPPGTEAELVAEIAARLDG